MSATTCRCGITFTGLRTQHCCACHETFTGTASGDKHRVGDPSVYVGANRRRCLTVAEMGERGMVRNGKGWWKSSADSPTFFNNGANV